MEPKETENNVVQETTRRKKGAVEAQIYKLKDTVASKSHPVLFLPFLNHFSLAIDHAPLVIKTFCCYTLH